MKKLCFLVCLFISFNVIGQSTVKRITVKFKKTTNYSIDHDLNKFYISDKFGEAVLQRNNLIKITSLINQKQVLNIKSIELIKNIQFLQFRTDNPISAIISELQETNLFEYVEEDFVGTSGGGTSVIPNDTYFNRQWGLLNNGTFNAQSTVGADVMMTQAWSRTTGSTGTIVCVLDGGTKFDHPEFAGRIWVNAGEIPNNNIDDDSNGYIDDINGWDWANNDKDPTDDYGHGTNVAGIIGANSNNNSGYAGVNWNCKLMIGKILDNTNSGFYSWWTSGIYYAVANGAKIINMSVGGSGFSQSMKDACDFAFNNNVTILASMMNTNNNVPYYPAAYSSTIAIGATTVNDYRANPFAWGGGSNYGSHIDVVAPGNFIYGLAYNSNTNYNTYWSGTSQATPLVTGIVSLMYGIKPSITVSNVRTILRTTANDLVGNPAEDILGFDQYMGYGRVNAAAALTSNVLPLTMGVLTASLIQGKAQLYWKTFEETNIKQFEIEHSINLLNWNKAGLVASNGNSSITQNYSFTDNIIQNEINYYRLKIIEKNSSFSFSNICIIKPVFVNEIKLQSTIINDELKLNFLFKKTELVNYSIFSISGALLLHNSLTITTGNSVLPIKLNNIPDGLYVIKITNSMNQLLLSNKFLKQ